MASQPESRERKLSIFSKRIQPIDEPTQDPDNDPENGLFASSHLGPW